jgi:hypothetical protein
VSTIILRLMKTLTWSLHSHYGVSSQCFCLGSSLIPDICPASNASDILHFLQVSRLQSRTVETAPEPEAGLQFNFLYVAAEQRVRGRVVGVEIPNSVD